MILKLTLKCGAEELIARVDMGDAGQDLAKNDVETDGESSSSEDVLKTVGDLRSFIASRTNADPKKVKIIHKGKLISDNNEEPLSNYKFKCTDKLMVMGVPRKAAGVENHGLKLLTDYEKKQLIPLNEMFIKNGKDVAELERNFLQGEMVQEMIKRTDKQLQTFTQQSLKHLETIDGLPIFDDSTSEEQKQRNREKRKTMIKGVQELLNHNDKLLFQLSQYAFRTEHPDEGHD